jgi:hypothetical protein
MCKSPVITPVIGLTPPFLCSRRPLCFQSNRPQQLSLLVVKLNHVAVCHGARKTGHLRGDKLGTCQYCRLAVK